VCRFDELAARYEEPDAMRRWDAPLFIVTHEDKELPFDDIWSALVLRKAPPPNMATAVVRTINLIIILIILFTIIDLETSG
jgi:tRNA uridine 5-carbamoylmethylation protein Kti12